MAAAATPPPPLLLSGQHLVGLGPRPAARSCCSSLPRCQPAATPVSHRPPPTTLQVETSAPTCGSTAPPPPLPSQPGPSPSQGCGGEASPWRAPRCACTLAVTCEAGEQRFRCVRGVRAQLAGSGYTKLPTGGAISRYSSYPFLICTLQTPPLLDSQIMGGKGFPVMACPMRCAACMAALSSM